MIIFHDPGMLITNVFCFMLHDWIQMYHKIIFYTLAHLFFILVRFYIVLKRSSVIGNFWSCVRAHFCFDHGPGDMVFCRQVFLVALFLSAGLRAGSQTTENSAALNTIYEQSILDTNVILRWIDQGKRQASRNRDSATGLLERALAQSQLRRFAHGMKKSLKELLPLLSEAERARLLARLLPVCSRTEKLRGVLAVIYNAQAKSFQLRGLYQQAGEHYMKAIPLAQQYMPDYLATIYNNYGSLLLFFPGIPGRDSLQGFYYLDKAEQIAKQYHDLKTITCVLCNKGKIFRDRKQYDTSLTLSLEGLRIAQKEGFVQWEFVLLNNIGDLYYSMGRPMEAIPYLERAIKSDNEHMDPYYRNMAVVTLGEVYFDLGKYGKAEYYLQRSLSLATQFHIGRDLIAANKKLAALYNKVGNYKKAFSHQLRYSAMKDSLMGKDVVENIRDMELKYRTAEKDKELLRNKLSMEMQTHQLRKKNTIILITVAFALILVLIFLIIYSRIRQQQKILLRDEQIREMKALIKGEEQERIRLAQELHDGIGGMLAAVNINMNVARKREFRDKAELNSIMQMIEDTTDEVRKTSHNLMPSALLRKNLREALQYYCDYVNKDGALRLDLNIDGRPDTLNATYITLIFRVVQELIQNIIKHARATHAIVSLEQIGTAILLIVEDNGVGFIPDETPPGFGLEHLRFRIKALGGDFKLKTAPGLGTSITITFKLKSD